MSRDKQPMGDGFINVPKAKPSRLRRFTAWIAGFLLAGAIGFILLRILLAGDGERIQTLHNFSASPWLFLFRLTIYLLIWRYWEKLLHTWAPSLGRNHVRLSRRPLLVLLISYELFFASDIINLFI